MSTVEQVAFLSVEEAASVDRDRLAILYSQLGAARAEQLICQAIEELAVRLTHADRLFRSGNLDELVEATHGMTTICEQIGLTGIALVAEYVADCARRNDGVALAATMARLIRSGERSLTAVWDLQDQMI
ncbi:hypothetical protein [Mesobacterium pallidum]|uniref:hypothetical protein n=1 Tax=Mesobacterium pallidum TaxID=2872037 RepID=UPI001EE20CBE